MYSFFSHQNDYNFDVKIGSYQNTLRSYFSYELVSVIVMDQYCIM